MPPSTTSDRIQPLHLWPLEIRRSILRFTNDLELAIKLECIWAYLPSLYPTNPLLSFNAIDSNLSFVPVSTFLSRTRITGVYNAHPIYMSEYVVLLSNFSDLTVAWLVRFGPVQWDFQCTTEMATKGRLNIIRMLHDIGSNTFTTGAMDKGTLDVVRFLHENRTEGCSVFAMYHAAWKGDFKLVQFLHENYKECCTEDAMDTAAEKGYIDIVRFLHQHRTEGCTSRAMDMAASHGHLDVVRFLHQHRTEGCTSDAMDMAVYHGHLDVVRFLHQHGTED